MTASRQRLQSYNNIRSAMPGASGDFIADYAGMKDDILELMRGISPQLGTGSPEGVIRATASLVYYDVTNSPVSVTGYFNDTIGSNTGWVQIV